MANLGFQTVYHLFNSIDNCLCERVFLPDDKDIAEYSSSGTPLFSLESQTQLKDFDIIAFSLPFEEDYINIPKILGLANIPARSTERNGKHPLIVGGGVAVSLNPEPLADFFDLFLLGEAEGALEGFIKTFQHAHPDKDDILKKMSKLDGVYMPSFYEFQYDGAQIRSIENKGNAKDRIKVLKNPGLKGFAVPQSFIKTPDAEFSGACLVEVERGCGRGCRFCAAGFLYMPPRWRDFEDVEEAILNGVADTGKAGLVGTAVSEYPWIKESIKAGIRAGAEVTLSSLRMDMLDGELLALLKESKYKTMTLAPEAGTERLRRVINKGITDDELFEAVRLVSSFGFRKLKLYFLIGLPTETDEDALSIAGLAIKIKEIVKSGEITLSVNPFIPKPLTPFQWHRFESVDEIERRAGLIKGALLKKGITVKSMPAKEAFVQAYLSRADRRAGAVILNASFEGWRKAVKKAAAFIEESACSQKTKESVLAWDLLDHGIKKDYLWKEYKKALEARETPPCNVGSCFRCGVC